MDTDRVARMGPIRHDAEPYLENAVVQIIEYNAKFELDNFIFSVALNLYRHVCSILSERNLCYFTSQ